MKRPLLIAMIAVAVVVVLAVAGIKHIPADQQALCVKGDKVVATCDPGNHIVWPFSGKLVRFPLGVVELRAPATGVLEATTLDGAGVTAVINMRIEVGRESARLMFDKWGADYREGIESAVGEVFEIVSASHSLRPGAPLPAAYGEKLIEDITMTLAETQLVLQAWRIENWSVADSGEPVSVDPKPLRKLIVVGVDGGDWHIIDPLMEQGLLPNFARLVRDGATGPLRSTEPMLSPLLWTTMATGKSPEEHGILNFTVVDPETGHKVPISRLYRKVDAYWNMLSDYTRTVDVVGWLATFPAETINGVMVTDRLGYLAYAHAQDDNEPLRGSVSPESRLQEISGLVVTSDDVTWDAFRKFVHVDEPEFVSARSREFDPKDPVNNMIMLYASTRTYEAVAKHLLTTDRPDFMAVYFELVDATKHLFMHYAPPKEPQVSDADFARYRDAVKQAYVEQDRILGEFLAMCDDSTVLMVLSDHGFKSGDTRPHQRPEIWAGKAAFWHLIDGIICVYGPGIKKGYRISGAGIMDVAPTILALQGLPKPTDMRGRVLEDVMEPSLVSRLNRTPVGTLQRDRDIGDLARETDDAATQEALKKLEALGYITPENQDAHNNLGQILQKEGRFREAIAEYEKALALNPNFPSALNNIGVCYGRLKEYDKAERSFRRALTINAKDIFAMNNLAIMFLETRRFEDAREIATQAVTVEPNYANGYLTLGSIYATTGEHDQAEVAFRKVLEIDPSNQRAKTNLDRLEAARNR